MPEDPSVLAADLRERGLRLLGGLWVGAFAPGQREQERQRAWKSDTVGHPLVASYLIAADSGGREQASEPGGSSRCLAYRANGGAVARS